MIKIGLFARLGQVSVKTLRFYDEAGLLKPVRVDDASGYRFYALAQLARLNRILALKDLGFSLEEITTLLDDPAPDVLRAAFAARHAALSRRVRDDQARLMRVEARLNQIDREGQMSSYDVVVKKVEPQLVASVQAVIPDWEQVAPTFNRLFDELIGYVHGQGGKMAGAPFDFWHDTGAMPNENMRVEALVPLQERIAESETVRVYQLASVEMAACVLHHGDFSTLTGAHEAVVSWAEANGLRVCGPCREIYLQYERNGNPADWLTEIQYPVEKE